MKDLSSHCGHDNQPRLLVIGRLLKVQGNGRREKVAEELKAFARQGFSIDCVTFDDATPDIFDEYRHFLNGIVQEWHVWKDPFLAVVRFLVRGWHRCRHRNASDPGRNRQRPKIRPTNPANILLSLPDPNIGWYLFHRKKLIRLVEQKRYTHLYTLSSPHSIQFTGYYIKKHYPELKWIASFRDPWSAYPLQYPGSWVSSFNRHAEQRCLQACDQAVIYRGWMPGGRQTFVHLYGEKLAGKIVEAPYIGCDEKEIDHILENYDESGLSRGNRLHFVHLGTLYGYDHTPVPFLKALQEYLERYVNVDIEIQVTFLGGITADAEKVIRANKLLKEHVNVEQYLPYEEAVVRVANSHVALWFQAKHSHFSENIPAKVFEYVYLGLPVMSISTTKDCIRLLEENGLGWTFMAENTEGIVKAINELAHRRERGEVLRIRGIQPFPRRHFVHWFEQMVVKPAVSDK